MKMDKYHNHKILIKIKNDSIWVKFMFKLQIIIINYTIKILCNLGIIWY